VDSQHGDTFKDERRPVSAAGVLSIAVRIRRLLLAELV